MPAPRYYTSLAKAVGSNENTVRNYLEYARRSYIVSEVTNFSFSLKEETRPLHKAYGIDTGLMNAVGFQFIQRSGMALENIAYNELINNGYTEIAFARQQGGEIEKHILRCVTGKAIAKNNRGLNSYITDQSVNTY